MPARTAAMMTRSASSEDEASSSFCRIGEVDDLPRLLYTPHEQPFFNECGLPSRIAGSPQARSARSTVGGRLALFCFLGFGIAPCG